MESHTFYSELRYQSMKTSISVRLLSYFINIVPLITPPVMPSTTPSKVVFPKDSKELSKYISMHCFWWGSFTDVYDTSSFYDPSGGFVVGYEADNGLVFWRPGRILSRLFAIPSVSLLIRYLGSKMGRPLRIWDVCYRRQSTYFPQIVS